MVYATNFKILRQTNCSYFFANYYTLSDMNTTNVDNIIQFALLSAGQEDDYMSQQLGPIHIIKYVYIADLAYASRNQGNTFTEIDWKFHNFGPWSFELHERIEPALCAINASKQSFPSDYQDQKDWIRWKLDDDSLFDSLRSLLPVTVTSSVKSAVHKFGNATPDLLDFIYSTKPMCHVAPGEYLDFSILNIPERPTSTVSIKKKTARQKKMQKQALADLRERNKLKLENRRLRRDLAILPPAIVYDEIYTDGLQWLDNLAGEPIKQANFDVSFSDLVWKSSTRNLNDLP